MGLRTVVRLIVMGRLFNNGGVGRAMWVPNPTLGIYHALLFADELSQCDPFPRYPPITESFDTQIIGITAAVVVVVAGLRGGVS